MSLSAVSSQAYISRHLPPKRVLVLGMPQPLLPLPTLLLVRSGLLVVSRALLCRARSFRLADRKPVESASSGHTRRQQSSAAPSATGISISIMAKRSSRPPSLPLPALPPAPTAIPNTRSMPPASVMQYGGQSGRQLQAWISQQVPIVAPDGKSIIAPPVHLAAQPTVVPKPPEGNYHVLAPRKSSLPRNYRADVRGQLGLSIPARDDSHYHDLRALDEAGPRSSGTRRPSLPAIHMPSVAPRRCSWTSISSSPNDYDDIVQNYLDDPADHSVPLSVTAGLDPNAIIVSGNNHRSLWPSCSARSRPTSPEAEAPAPRSHQTSIWGTKASGGEPLATPFNTKIGLLARDRKGSVDSNIARIRIPEYSPAGTSTQTAELVPSPTIASHRCKSSPAVGIGSTVNDAVTLVVGIQQLLKQVIQNGESAVYGWDRDTEDSGPSHPDQHPARSQPGSGTFESLVGARSSVGNWAFRSSFGAAKAEGPEGDRSHRIASVGSKLDVAKGELVMEKARKGLKTFRNAIRSGWFSKRKDSDDSSSAESPKIQPAASTRSSTENIFKQGTANVEIELEQYMSTRKPSDASLTGESMPAIRPSVSRHVDLPPDLAALAVRQQRVYYKSMRMHTQLQCSLKRLSRTPEAASLLRSAESGPIINSILSDDLMELYRDLVNHDIGFDEMIGKYFGPELVPMSK
ncbi:uncharacterized protein BJ171DRAFT_502039 [Polychytrium aggregatum]|uniref:uncharacterized protein n=1 Tax=Polychytrium aggregatum TaxID=110093 RepID=UPI0022FDC9E6|nr:uncharacterized protein BJ171DRAFT_502039 [Polychytrium aggregatum]KAI9205413.1 hypothetical protein BJ171DRAFT_502039 [Polychytrium aggregatum]